MATDRTFDRRSFLYGTAFAASAAVLTACSGDSGQSSANGGAGAQGKGSAKEPLAAPKKLKESPLLTKQVKAGKLPELSERLPEKPYVVPHKWLEEGKYGGTLRIATKSTSGAEGDSNRQFMYGHSPLRWLNDGLDIGPGLAESWDTNSDMSEWTFHFRKGLKWSDGEPWTTADIMFWWEDIALNDEHTEVPPDECRSGKGNLVKMSAPDDYTLVMKFDSPAPLTADRIAMWVKRGTGNNGPMWMLPKHYLKQWHPKYNKNAPKDWASAGGAFETKGDHARNPDCPTMTGWRLKSYNEGRSLVWERNPYYYAVSPDGAQLPYIDEFVMTVVQDEEVAKLEVQQGKVDYAHGPFVFLTLFDFATLKKSTKEAGTDVFMWDSGSGTGSIFFFNLDHRDPELRKLFRDKRFRRAMSYAFDRAEVQKAIYFKTGEPTTGTMSTKAIEYHVNDKGKKVYKDWRDSHSKHDPDEAKRLLDELGVKDTDGDGIRELPSGKKLTLSIDYPSDAAEDHVKKDQILVRDWKKIGIKATTNPIPAEGYEEQWEASRLMIRTGWEVGDGPNHLVYPQWMVPLEATRWAPLQGKFAELRGTPAAKQQLDRDPFERTPPRMEAEPGGPVEKLWKLHDQSKVEPDEMKRHQLVWEMIKIHIDEGPFFIGSVANTAQVIVTKTDLRNVPRRSNLAQGGFVNPWIHPTPAVYDPEAYFWENPDQHS